MYFLSLFVTALVTTHVHATEVHCNRLCLKQMVDQVLVSTEKHDPSILPVADRYRLTVNNMPSSLSMAVPWRTISSFKAVAPGNYVIDTERQEVFFVSTVVEGSLPSLLWGRLKVKDRKLSEMEFYLSRGTADSGAKFDPNGLTKLPSVWTHPIPPGKQATRAELTRVAQTIFNPGMGELDYSLSCHLVENGYTLPNTVRLDDWLKYNASSVSKEKLVELKAMASSHNGIAELGCPRIDAPTDKQARILVDEVQGIALSLAMVPGKVIADLMPSPDPKPGLPTTVFVPDSMANDQSQRIENERELPTSHGRPVSLTMPAVLAAAQFIKFYDGRMQGVRRLMQGQPAGSKSPWVGDKHRVQ